MGGAVALGALFHLRACDRSQLRHRVEGALVIPNPWIILGIAVVWALSVFGVGKWQYRVGQEHERVEWLARDNAALTAANAKIFALNNAARAKEKASVDAMATLSKRLTNERATNDARLKADAAAVRAGDLRLSIPASLVCPDGDFTGPPRPTASRSDGAARVELPQQITLDLLELAHDADAVADQLRACQTVVLNDRKETP